MIMAAATIRLPYCFQICSKRSRRTSSSTSRKISLMRAQVSRLANPGRARAATRRVRDEVADFARSRQRKTLEARAATKSSKASLFPASDCEARDADQHQPARDDEIKAKHPHPDLRGKRQFCRGQLVERRHAPARARPSRALGVLRRRGGSAAAE